MQVILKRICCSWLQDDIIANQRRLDIALKKFYWGRETFDPSESAKKEYTKNYYIYSGGNIL